MTFLRSLVFNALFFSASTVLVLACLVVMPFDRHLTRRIGVAWARTTLFLLRHVVGIRFELRGDATMLHGPAIVASKHQSAFDTIIFFLIAADPAYVMKKELGRIPVFGAAGRHQGMIFVDRDAGASAIRSLLRDAKRVIADRRQIVIFPQGTRTDPRAPTSEMPYQPGIAALYQSLGMPIVPLALNSGQCWGRRSFAKRAGTIVIEILPAIPAGMPREAMMRELESRIEAATQRLEAAFER
jgi:1-acyl-sn-glycerol-3-phosphate acyltransferase